MRTTVDLDPVILREAKERAAEEGKTLGRLISELLAPALKCGETASVEPFVWHTTRGGLLVDLEDKEAVWKILDER